MKTTRTATLNMRKHIFREQTDLFHQCPFALWIMDGFPRTVGRSDAQRHRPQPIFGSTWCHGMKVTRFYESKCFKNFKMSSGKSIALQMVCCLPSWRRRRRTGNCQELSKTLGGRLQQTLAAHITATVVPTVDLHLVLTCWVQLWRFIWDSMHIQT